MSHPVPFMKASNVAAPKKMAKDAPDLEEAIEDEDDGQAAELVEEDDDEIDFKKDKYIKQPKAKKTTKKAKGKDDADDDGAKAKPKGKVAATKKGKK